MNIANRCLALLWCGRAVDAAEMLLMISTFNAIHPGYCFLWDPQVGKDQPSLLEVDNFPKYLRTLGHVVLEQLPLGETRDRLAERLSAAGR